MKRSLIIGAAETANPAKRLKVHPSGYTFEITRSANQMRHSNPRRWEPPKIAKSKISLPPMKQHVNWGFLQIQFLDSVVRMPRLPRMKCRMCFGMRSKPQDTPKRQNDSVIEKCTLFIYVVTVATFPTSCKKPIGACRALRAWIFEASLTLQSCTEAVMTVRWPLNWVWRRKRRQFERCIISRNYWQVLKVWHLLLFILWLCRFCLPFPHGIAGTSKTPLRNLLLLNMSKKCR